jgi:hypothetical protein
MIGPQTGTAPPYGGRGAAMDWYARRTRVVDQLRRRGCAGAVTHDRTQERAVAPVLEVRTPDVRLWPHTQATVRQRCHGPWCPHGVDMDQAANEGLPAAALCDSLAVSAPLPTGACVMDTQSVATQRGPARPPTACARHGQRVAARTSQHARSDRMPQTVWHLSITGLIVWLLLLGCAGVRPARRQSCWPSARRMMPRWRRRRAPSGSGLWRA